MFNNSLKKEALIIHDKQQEEYNASYEKMRSASDKLYEIRCNSVELIKQIDVIINSITNTPKEFETTFGKIGKELFKFRKTKEFAQEAYDAAVRAGVNIAAGTTMGIGVAIMAPTAFMSIATTFGTASTGTAISALSGAAAQKAAVAWIGRTFAGFAVKEGAGMIAGKAFLALAGPIGWGITATSVGASLVSLSKKNKKIADEAVAGAKKLAWLRNELDESREKINNLKVKTEALYGDMSKQKNRIIGFLDANYLLLSEEDQYFLGALVNNTLSLSELLNKTIL